MMTLEHPLPSARSRPLRAHRVRDALFVVLLAALLSPSVALAQASGPASPAGMELQHFRPATGPRDGISTPYASLSGHLQVAGGLLLHFARRPLVFENANTGELYSSIVEDRLQADAYASVGLLDWVELSVLLPMSLYQDGSGSALSAPEDIDALGVGDLTVGTKVRIGELDALRMSFAFTLDVRVPSGQEGEFLGEGSVGVVPGLVASGELGPLRSSAQLAYRVREDRSFYNLDLQDELIYRVGVGMELMPDRMEGLAEVFGAVPAADPLGSQEEAPLELLLGSRYRLLMDLFLTAGFGLGLVRGYGTPEYRLLAGVAWAPQDSDRDEDGILDREDACRDDPEDKDGFEDLDGCPDPDNDRDRVLDVDDGCPADPEDWDGFEDSDGCPDPDNDKDGIPDAADRCPNEAEDADGFQDKDGCPERDNDKDGIVDTADRCPNRAEDRDGFQDKDGCPDPDNDADGILDKKDRCPLKAEVYNGIDDEDGCPDEGRVRIERGRIRIDEKIFFKFNSDVIERRSHGLLDEVAGTLKSQPRIKVVRIEGHTDGVGRAKYNLALSQRRAAAVMRYLVAKGVAPERLVAQGFGKDRPIDTNETAEGRSRNRRVDFVILEEE